MIKEVAFVDFTSYDVLNLNYKQNKYGNYENNISCQSRKIFIFDLRCKFCLPETYIRKSYSEF